MQRPRWERKGVSGWVCGEERRLVGDIQEASWKSIVTEELWCGGEKGPTRGLGLWLVTRDHGAP